MTKNTKTFNHWDYELSWPLEAFFEEKNEQQTRSKGFKTILANSCRDEECMLFYSCSFFLCKLLEVLHMYSKLSIKEGHVWKFQLIICVKTSGISYQELWNTFTFATLSGINSAAVLVIR